MLQQKFVRLKRILASFPDVVIAYSGGVDSTFLLKVATDVLGEKAVGVITKRCGLPGNLAGR